MSDEKIWETPWQPPGPTELPDLRAELAQQTQTGFELHSTAAVLKEGRGSIVPQAESAEESASILLEEEHQRLASAELYFASPEMTRLAVTAAESLPEFHLEPEDVPAPTGLIVFGEPIGSYTNTEAGFPMRLPIVAVSWGQWSPDGRWEHGTGVWLSFYTPTDFPALERLADHHRLSKAQRQRIRQARASLSWDNEMFFAYDGHRPANFSPGASYDADPDTISPWGQTVRTAWLLMSQPNIAEVEEHPQSRAARRRATRGGYSTSAVRLLHLRRATHEAGTPEEAPATREWTCRWMVSGHWRQQWYPKREVHRPVWIAPHVKGPEGKPFKAGETVHVWDR